MDQKTSDRAPVPEQIIYLYDRFIHGSMPRRQFLQKLATLAGSVAAASAMVPILEGDALARTVDPDDDRLDAGFETYDGVTGPINAYVSVRDDMSRCPAVVVIHQNRGLTHHIEDVARRLALEGFLAVAPDALSPMGGRPEPEDKTKGRDMMRELDIETTTGDFIAAVSYAKGHGRSTGMVGAVGFCWGGSMVGRLAVGSPDLDAGVVYYGGPPAAEDVAKIRAPMLLNYAGLDTRLKGRLPAYEEALKAAGTDYRLHIYEGAHHAFNDDTSDTRYNSEAAALAWDRTISFFRDRISG